uniref:Uncharacterized protein n=1 Tax=Hordeum vulgare subsp. vulgare TaxID=112509 RepID=A0A8I7B092_HORVV
MATLVVALQLLAAAAPTAMARSPPEEMEMAAGQSRRIAVERLVLRAPTGDARCGDETCYTGFCFAVAGCSCRYPYCMKPQLPTPVHA